jgi:3-hydroxyisobutyrate dehydrogenase-like beta-hydroxyacid dehydrogenase
MPNSEIENSSSTAVAVLGLGPMGQALATAIVSSGRPTVVWNRTAGKAARLVERGAWLAPSPAEAVRQASTVICCVMNYRALGTILDAVNDWSKTTLVNLTSGHSSEARAMGAWAAERSVPYLDGAILTPAPTIGTSSASILYSGPRPVFDRSRPVLQTLADSTMFVGEDHGAAAGYETALLDLFATAVGGVAHAFAMATAENIDPQAFALLAKGIGSLLTEQIDRFAGQLGEGHFPATISSIASLSSTTEHIIEAADAHGIDAGPLRALQAIMGRAVAAGHGGDGYAKLTQLIAEGHNNTHRHHRTLVG